MTDQDGLELQRLPSGVPGLDQVLGGGFLRGAACIVNGVPGAGKTVLANQVCFHHAASGGRAVYVTLLAESHTRMLQHLRPMSFFDEGAIPDRLRYLGAFRVLEEGGLKGLLDLIRREMRHAGASLMVLDGFGAAQETAASSRDFKRFVHEVQAHAEANGCAVLLLTTGAAGGGGPEHTIVDGVIELDNEPHGVRTERSLLVRKLRGSGPLRGRHTFRITPDGILVHPRIEAVLARPSRRDRPSPERVSIGVEGLDRMFGGGLVAGTTTLVLGPTGTGKTTLGQHFLSASHEGAPGLFFGFYETPERLRLSAGQKGIDLEGMEARGALEILWQPQGEHALDEVGHRLLDAVRRRGVRRLYVDGLGGLLESALHPERIGRYLSTLANELRALGVTSIFTLETQEVAVAPLRFPIGGISSLAEGVLALRYAEVDAALRRVALVMKIRDSDLDPRLHAYEITGRGIQVLGPYRVRYEGVLGGLARERQAASPPSQPPDPPPGLPPGPVGEG
jgi:circadian clock protein KaiC